MAIDFNTFKEDLKSRFDIVDIVGEYVELKRRGSNHTGLCPFHNEKTPSFSVNQAGQFYHCFGCGKGGDIFGFLMDITGMSFMETVEQLAERAGLEVSKFSAGDGVGRENKDRIIAANLAAAEYFYRTLSSDAGKAGHDYLIDRGLTQETITIFRLGFAPENPAELISFAAKKGVNARDLEAAGLLVPGRYGNKPYGRFGNRVIFPIIDSMRRVIGFGGRILEGEGAKYLNSPETLVYHKSQVLFGIHQAQDTVKKLRRAIIVEGYMDVISLYQAGIRNVMAASGTSFTVEQGKLIARMARVATLLFDGDKAGLSAAVRGADNLLATDLVINVVVLPGGHDPDSFIRGNGAAALHSLLDEPTDLWEFKLQVLAGNSATIQDRIKLAGEIADSISLIPDAIKRDLYIRDLSPKIDVDVNSMVKAVNGRIRRRSHRVSDETPKKSMIGTALDRELVGYIIKYPNLARRFMEETGASYFKDPVIAKVAEVIFHRIVEGLDITPSVLISALSDKRAQEFIASVSMVERDEITASKCIEDNIRSFKKSEIKTEVEALNQKINVEKDYEKKKRLVAKRAGLLVTMKKLDENGGGGL